MNKHFSTVLTFISASFLTSSCVSDESVAKENLTLCPDVRPQICTQDYNPVCARLEDGSWKSYPNGCTACGDPKVVGYRKGDCTDGKHSAPDFPAR